MERKNKRKLGHVSCVNRQNAYMGKCEALGNASQPEILKWSGILFLMPGPRPRLQYQCCF